MSEQPMSDSSKKVVFFQPLGAFLSSFIFSCCVPVLSQPVYFCYFLFFSTYIVKLLSFLSPLFVTTTLVLLSVQELGSASVLAGEPNLSSEELELYSILFETSQEHVVEQEVQETVDKYLIHGSSGKEVRVEKNETELQGSKTGAKAIFQEKQESDEITAFAVEGQEVKQPGTESKKVVPGEEKREEEEEESNAHVGNKITPRRWRSSRSLSLSSDGLGLAFSVSGDMMRPGLGSFGSMRKEKEWRRTLACKLFEERHSGGSGGGAAGEEGMDLLWETYEEDLGRARGRRKGRKSKGGGADPVPEAKTERRHDDVDEEEGDNVDEENVCCLQALKFSAGKINLCLGRPNVMGISRALREVGWSHSVRRHKGL